MLVKARKQIVGVGRVRSYFDVVPGLVVFARREILEDQTVTMVQIKLGTFRAHAEIGVSNVGVSAKAPWTYHPGDSRKEYQQRIF